MDSIFPAFFKCDVFPVIVYKNNVILHFTVKTNLFKGPINDNGTRP